MTRPGSRSTDERGLTLIEIAVVLLIMGLVVPLIAVLLETTQRQAAAATSRSAAAGQARIMNEALGRQIHAANYPLNGAAGSEIVVADASEFEFYTSLGAPNGPTLVDMKVTPACTSCTYDRLQETNVIPGGSPGIPAYSGSGTTVVLGTGIVAPLALVTGCPTTGTGIPVFEYFDASGNCLQTTANTAPRAGNPADLVMSNSSGQFAAIDSVTATFQLLDVARPTGSPRVSFTFGFSMPNVDFKNAGI